ncbi:hydrophobin [Schizophyllum commune]
MRVVSLSVLIISSLLGVGALPSASGCNAEGTWCCDKNTLRTDISGLIGKGCTPTSIIGIGRIECEGQTVCCYKTDQPTILGV